MCVREGEEWKRGLGGEGVTSHEKGGLGGDAGRKGGWNVEEM